MNIICATCGTKWSPDEAQANYGKDGFEFGVNWADMRRCTACAEQWQPAPARIARREALGLLLAEDPETFAACIEDLEDI